MRNEESHSLFQAFLVPGFPFAEQGVRLVQHLSADRAILSVRARKPVAAKPAIKIIHRRHSRFSRTVSICSLAKSILEFSWKAKSPLKFPCFFIPEEQTAAGIFFVLPLIEGLKRALERKTLKNFVQTLFFFIFLWYNIGV